MGHQTLRLTVSSCGCGPFTWADYSPAGRVHLLRSSALIAWNRAALPDVTPSVQSVTLRPYMEMCNLCRRANDKCSPPGTSWEPLCQSVVAFTCARPGLGSSKVSARLFFFFVTSLFSESELELQSYGVFSTGSLNWRLIKHVLTNLHKERHPTNSA